MSSIKEETERIPGQEDQKEKVERYLQSLLAGSEDPDYDRYLEQMMRDLKSGKATPFQVEREAQRTYRLYLERVKPKGKNSMEFRIGAGIFSVVGAVFLLAAFMIFGLNFMSGIWQGVCLYAASLIIMLASELLIRRLNGRFARVITGIGLAGLFLSTVINYVVLEVIGEMAACLITLVIVFLAVLTSRKKDAASIRLITILGCYVSFWPIQSFESELNFLIVTGMILLINLVFILLPNQKNRIVTDTVHMALHPLFTGAVAAGALEAGMDAVYPACFIITSLIILNLIFLGHKKDPKAWFAAIFSMAAGFCVMLLAAATGFRYGTDAQMQQQLFYRLIAEVMAIAVLIVFFVLWEKRRSRWILYYLMAAVAVALNGFGLYNWEKTVGILTVFVLTGILSKIRELKVLDGIVTVLAALEGISLSSYYNDTGRYIWFFFAAFVLSVLWIRHLALFHEIVITLFTLYCIRLEFSGNWVIPACTALLLLFFLLFNHLPWLRGQRQLPYNIINASLAGLFCFSAWFAFDSAVSSVTMLIGAAAIVIVFRERYGMSVPRKYLILASFLVVMILTAHYESPVTVSILLMIVSIGCVGIGFRLKDRVYRIGGLSMAAVVCVKLVIYDFRGLDSLPRIIVFFSVGMIALGISFLYIHLEKKQEAEEKTEKKEEPASGEMLTAAQPGEAFEGKQQESAEGLFEKKTENNQEGIREE